jgi:GNAT superfamily N-acetyltransferase
MGKDPMNGEEVLVACAYWYFFSKPRSSEQMHRENYLLSADWIPEEGGQRKQVKRHLQPVLDTRLKWNTGRGHAILMYMATEKQWRRKGAATVVVQWGLDRCRERNIPAFLEASEDGAPVYARLGFEKVDDIVVDIDGDKSVSPVMMWWPPGTKDEDKRPLTE